VLERLRPDIVYAGLKGNEKDDAMRRRRQEFRRLVGAPKQAWEQTQFDWAPFAPPRPPSQIAALSDNQVEAFNKVNTWFHSKREEMRRAREKLQDGHPRAQTFKVLAEVGLAISVDSYTEFLHKATKVMLDIGHDADDQLPFIKFLDKSKLADVSTSDLAAAFLLHLRVFMTPRFLAERREFGDDGEWQTVFLCAVRRPEQQHDTPLIAAVAIRWRLLDQDGKVLQDYGEETSLWNFGARDLPTTRALQLGSRCVDWVGGWGPRVDAGGAARTGLGVALHPRAAPVGWVYYLVLAPTTKTDFNPRPSRVLIAVTPDSEVAHARGAPNGEVVLDLLDCKPVVRDAVRLIVEQLCENTHASAEHSEVMYGDLTEKAVRRGYNLFDRTVRPLPFACPATRASRGGVGGLAGRQLRKRPAQTVDTVSKLLNEYFDFVRVLPELASLRKDVTRTAGVGPEKRQRVS